jgi:NADH-quinone oxidoreductase subunit L
MEQLVWLVPFFPLLGFAIIGLFNRSLSKSLTGILASGAVIASFGVSLAIFLSQLSNPNPVTVHLFDWINAGGFSAPMAFLVDPLSSLFLMIITGVGSLIHIYSAGYMHDDDGIRRFFAYLNLFIFFMLLLVLGNNYLVMFVGWEGVGLCSYLLIGFWFKNVEYSSAAKKAFIMNRIGDLGYLLGILMIYTTFGSVTYSSVFAAAPTLIESNSGLIVSITLLLFIGAMGKSAQLPLYTWLPDAMAGPTPVSALIHAATMVTAGIYMIARSNVLFTLAPTTMTIILLVGLATALLAASIGLFQNDIKKVLAYSTVSQLGLMFAALGAGAYTAGVFHVMTHAFFKALLFLGAGSVIHAMGGEQDIRRMGGLSKHIKTTHITFLIGTLAIAGIPLFAGFFSKDQILGALHEHGLIYWIAGLCVSLMTCFYMFRLYFVTFHGKFRGTHEQEHHLHESPISMTMPLMVLATLSVIGGFFGVPHFLGEHFHFHNHIEGFLTPVLGVAKAGEPATEMTFMCITLGLIALVWFLARNRFVTQGVVPAEDDNITGFQKVVYNKYYIDELYNTIITKPLNAISAFFSNVVDNVLVDGAVNGVGSSVKRLGTQMRQLQTGNIGFYILMMVFSIVLIFAFSVIAQGLR